MNADRHTLKVFISYKWESDTHNEWVEKLATDLRRAGIESFLDKWEVRLGESFTDYMTSRISEADAVLFIMTTASVAAAEARGQGGAVKFEMQMATSRRTAGEEMRLIGIYREGDKTAEHLRDHRYADFRDDSRYLESLKVLVSDLLGESKAPPIGRKASPIIKKAPPIGGQGDAPMVLIPAGEFMMGSSDGSGNDDEKPVHTVYLDAFYMDVYEVTNARYAKFLNEYGKSTDDYGNELLNLEYYSTCQIKRSGNTYRPNSGYEDHPVEQVSWYGADAYATWAGKRLPTEAEWEKAARGGLVGEKYPWGDMPPYKTLTNFDYNESGTTPVGKYPPNGYGLYDMAGNVWEWCSDWRDWDDKDYYKRSPKRNPKGLDTGEFRVMRGGSYLSNEYYLRVSYRIYFRPKEDNKGYGFRCAKDANP